MIGIATTCLSETIGDDMQKLLSKYKKENDATHDLPSLVYVNTPSYSGTHADGFHNAILALVKTFASSSETNSRINVFPGFLSPADIRHIKEITESFGLETNLLADYSEVLDNGYTGEYERIPKGGTPMESIRNTASARASIELGHVLNKTNPKAVSAGEYLEQKFSVPRVNLGIPVGINETDYFFNALENLSGYKTPEKYKKQRARLVDAYVDGHKYLFGKRAVVYGEEDFVAAMVSFLEEIGIETVLCATGGNSGLLKKVLNQNVLLHNEINVHENYDFEDIASACENLRPDLLIGNSKGYYIARKLEIPLVRVGFPIHDRVGGQRLLHVGYEGTQQLFDIIANALIDYTQEHSPVGYKYM